MQLNKELAELTGTILGDGCLSKYWSNSENCFRYEIAFTGNLDERSYYQEFIIPVFKKNFGMRGRLVKRKGENATRFHMKSHKVFSFFQALGLPLGKKPKTMKIPEKIMQDRGLALACVRGIWDTDGCVYLRYKKQYAGHPKCYSNYLVMQLKMKAKNLLEQIQILLKSEGINCNRICEEGDIAILRITEQKSIQAFLLTIGFRNNHHLVRLKKFKATNLNLFS